MTTQSIRTGVFNFNEFESSGTFYPEDMPTDWRIDYFANEFETACIFLDENANIEAIEEMLANKQGNPHRNFELAFALNDIEYIDLYQGLQNKYDAEIFACIVTSECYDALQLQHSRSEISYFSFDIIAGLKNLPTLWQPELSTSSSIALLPNCRSVKTCRDWIETWVEALNDNKNRQDLLLWVDARQTSYSDLNQLRILVELMGY